MCNKNIFEYLGLFFLFIVSFKVFRSICSGVYQCFIGPSIGMTVNFKELGQWAVVTGATDGIGKAYAEELAARGVNIVLISRTQAKLEAVAAEIKQKYKVAVKIIAVDFTKGREIYELIRTQLSGLEIGVLVNNVGIGYSYPEYLLLIPEGDQLVEDILKANAMAVTMMTRIVLGHMEKRRKGAIINIASLSALFPTPLLSIYSASKAYMDFLSRALQVEYRNKGILVQSVLPGYVVTNMSKMERTTWNIPMPREYVRWAIGTVGIEDKTYGYPTHKLMAYIYETVMLYLPTGLMETKAYNVQKSLRDYHKNLLVTIGGPAAAPKWDKSN